MKIPNIVTHSIGCTISLAFALLLGLVFLGCCFLAVPSILGVAKCCCVGQFGKELVCSLLTAALGCGGALYIACIFWRNAIPRRPKDAELQVPAQGEFPLTYASLEQRMEDMYAVGGDEEVELDKDARFLSWDDRAMRDIVIQGLGGEDWMAFFWPLRGMDDICLSRAQLEELCGREGVLLTDCCRGFQPGAVAFCRGGRLVVYPASAMADFMEYYPPMRDEDAFRSWMDECIRMGCLDC